MKRIIFALGLALTAMTALPARLDFSYNFGGAPSEGYGTSKTETYDVAVRLANPSLTGAKISGIRVAVPSGGITDASGWLSSSLKLKKKNGKNVNDPDIASVATSPADGWLDIAFEQPCTIPAEGVYVGYSFTVTDLAPGTETPVSVAAGTDPDGLFLHTSRTKLRWGPMSEETGKVSTMAVVLEGTFPERAAVFTVGEIKAAAGEAARATLQIVNCGTSPVSTVEYAGTAAGMAFTGAATLQAPLSGHICAKGLAAVEIPAVEKPGGHPLKLRVTRVNGVAVECPETEGTVKVYPFLPVNRPLVEEYTGLWCGWCPKGYVALETMKERKGNLFIAVAYHDGDDMEFRENTPNSPSGYPAAYVNRSASIDILDIYDGWDNYRTWIPDGGVEVAAAWTDDSHKKVKATATARFTEGHSGADYRLSYILVADGLSDPRWKQSNSYSGLTDRKPEMPGHWGDIFINGGSKVEGLTFNDVAVAATDFDGERGSIPAEIAAGEEYAHSHLFDLEEISESLGENAAKVLANPDKLRVVAVLTDGRSGKFINCNSSPLMNGDPFVDTSSVGSVGADGRPVEIARWTIDGRPAAAPVEGVNIVRYSDGTVRKEIAGR